MTSYAAYRIAETIRVLLLITLAIVAFNLFLVTPVMIVFLAVLNEAAILSIAYRPCARVGYARGLGHAHRAGGRHGSGRYGRGRNVPAVRSAGTDLTPLLAAGLRLPGAAAGI